MIKILIVDDEKKLCNALKFAFNDNEYEACAVDNIVDFNKMISIYRPDVVLLDLNFGQVSGLDLLDSIKESFPDTAVIIMTAYGTIETAIKAIKKGAVDYVSKPLEIDELRTMIKNSVRFGEIRRNVINLSSDDSMCKVSMIGDSPAVRVIYDKIDKIKDKDVNVLIEGESGTGKELVAKLVHASSNRSDKPFIAVNCGAIPDNLMESELFGFEKGAFTGADSYKKGKFELADGGTLFLDEIGDISQTNQVKLLRVLQEKIVQPLGNGRPVNTDVRIIAATNKNLRDEVSAGNFRGDLYFRLNVVSIHMPSLKERRDDIPLLVRYFTAEANRKYSTKVSGITDDAMEMLMNHNYTGNIRELENIIYSAILLSEDDIIDSDGLKQYVRSESAVKQEEKCSTLMIEVGSKMADIEEQVIMSTIKLVNGNKSKAAKVLGISERSIHYKTKNYTDKN